MSRNAALDGHIINIIQHQNISEQSDLQNTLRGRGYAMPQATLSRRLRQLGIAKVSGVYKIIDLQQSNLPLVLSMQVSEFGLLVLRTHPGNANSVAYFIDQKYVTCHLKDSMILGTIAGDDTVLVIMQSKKHLESVLAIMHQEFPYLGVL